MSWDNLWNQTSQTDAESLDLDAGEVILDRASNVTMGDGTQLEEAILTSKHLILSAYERSGLFSMELVNRHYPLRNLCAGDGKPAVYVTKTTRSYAVTLVFGRETLLLRFGHGKKTQQTWATEIVEATERLGKASSKTHATDGQLVTRKCIGCGAPITGREGHAVTCEYCGTRQTL